MDQDPGSFASLGKGAEAPQLASAQSRLFCPLQRVSGPAPFPCVTLLLSVSLELDESSLLWLEDWSPQANGGSLNSGCCFSSGGETLLRVNSLGKPRSQEGETSSHTQPSRRKGQCGGVLLADLQQSCRELHAAACSGVPAAWVRLSLWHRGCSGLGKSRLSQGQHRVLGKERNRDTKHREPSVFPVRTRGGKCGQCCRYPGYGAAQPWPQHRAPTLTRHPLQDAGCWPCVAEGDYAQLWARVDLFALSYSAWLYWTVCSG